MNNIRSQTRIVSPTSNDQPYYPVDWWLVIVSFTAAALAGLWFLRSGRNYQEMFNIGVASHLFTGTVFAYTSPDDPMPLYYLLIHGLSYWWFVPSLALLRFVSFMCYVLSLPLVYLVGRRAAGDRRVGLLAEALLAVSPFMAWYASRATVYAPLVLVVIINLYFFISILQQRHNIWPWYILSALVGLGLHYFFGIVLITQLVFILLERRNMAPVIKYYIPLSAVIFVAAFTAWAYVSAQHTTVWHYLPYTGRPSATNVFIIFVQFLFGFQSVVTTTFVIALWPLLVVTALFAVQKYVGPPIAVRYFAFAAFLPVMIMFTLGWLWRPLFLSSYFIVCLPPFILLVSWYLVAFELKALAWARVILVFTMICLLFVQAINPTRALLEDYLGRLMTDPGAYQPALSASDSAYDGHHTPAAGPPLQVPSDSPGALTHR